MPSEEPISVTTSETSDYPSGGTSGFPNTFPSDIPLTEHNLIPPSESRDSPIDSISSLQSSATFDIPGGSNSTVFTPSIFPSISP